MSKKLTPWYPGHIKPVRPGVYEAEFAYGPLFFNWQAGHWSVGSRTTQGAAAMGRGFWNEPIRWRGLVQEPKA